MFSKITPNVAPKTTVNDKILSSLFGYSSQAALIVGLGALYGHVFKTLSDQDIIQRDFKNLTDFSKALPITGAAQGALFFGTACVIGAVTSPLITGIFNEIFPPKSYKLPNSRMGIGFLRGITSIVINTSLAFFASNAIGKQIGVEFPPFENLKSSTYKLFSSIQITPDYIPVLFYTSSAALIALSLCKGVLAYQLAQEASKEAPKADDDDKKI